MKKIFIIGLMYSICSFGMYNFPVKNIYKATILGSSKMMVKDIPNNIPEKEYTLKYDRKEEIIPSMWFEKGFKFSLSKQKKKAPLIFILSGTGSAYNSGKTRNFQRIFYKAGYHVVTITSVFHPNFLINRSSTKVPGLLGQDAIDLYKTLIDIMGYVKNKEKIEIEDYNLMGYSMGATHSAMLGYVDSLNKKFNFNKIYMVNPSINLYYSSQVLDKMLIENVKSKNEISDMIDEVIKLLQENNPNGGLDINEETIYKVFSSKKMTDKKMKEIIGFAFNMTSIDLNFVSDQYTGGKVYGNKIAGKFTNMYPYYQAIDFASFEDYLTKIAYPYYYKKYGLNFNELIKYANLNIIKNYLKNNKNIFVVTNEDDFIISKADKEFIKSVFKNRNIIYPYGGHCGNMFYQENVDNMLEFFKSGGKR